MVLGHRRDMRMTIYASRVAIPSDIEVVPFKRKGRAKPGLRQIDIE
jgi:hypothetical protein